MHWQLVASYSTVNSADFYSVFEKISKSCLHCLVCFVILGWTAFCIVTLSGTDIFTHIFVESNVLYICTLRKLICLLLCLYSIFIVFGLIKMINCASDKDFFV